MGKLHVFEVVVSNVRGICHPGGLLKGEVRVETTQVLDVNELRIDCRGEGRVFWVDNSRSSPMVETQIPTHHDHVAEEEYIAASITLWSGSLPKGYHNLPFEFLIPDGVPSSFVGEFGHVRYWLKAFLDRAGRVDNNARQFTVLAKVDLNQIPDANKEVEASDHMKVSALFSPSGICHALLRLDRRGFVPGEIIPLTFTIHNDTSRDVHKVVLEVRETTDYRTGSQDRKTERIVSKIKFGRIPARTTYEKRVECLRLSECPPDKLNGCCLMHMYHEVVLKVKPSVLSFKQMKIPIELIVGTVPFKQGSRRSGVGKRKGLLGVHTITREYPVTPPPMFKTLPPRSFTTDLNWSPTQGSAPPSPDTVDRRISSIQAPDEFLAPPPARTPPRPRANTNSSILRARGR